MSNKQINFSSLTVRGPLSYTNYEHMQAASYAKYRIIKEFLHDMENAREYADQNFNEILEMQEEQGDEFSTKSYDYTSKKESYLEYITMVDLYEKIIQWLYEA